MDIVYCAFYFGFAVKKGIENALGENRTRILPSGEVRSIHWTTSATYILYLKTRKISIPYLVCRQKCRQIGGQGER